MWQFVARGFVIAAWTGVIASFGGDVHGIGDSLAVFRSAILVGAVGVGVLVWRWWVAQTLIGVVALIGLSQVLDGRFASDPVTVDLTHYQKNLLYFERDRTAFVADVLASGADVVTLQEVSPSNEIVLDLLSADYPYQWLCNARRVRTNAILSRTPLEEEDCSVQSGFAHAVTQVRGRAVQVYSMHLYWPYPYNQRAQVSVLEPILKAQVSDLTVVGGDFNMVPWGRSVAVIERATGTDRIGRPAATYDLYGYPLAIDHILATGGIGSLEARPKLGSDHRGLVARIAFPSAP